MILSRCYYLFSKCCENMQLWMMPKSDQIVEKFQKFPQLYLVAHSCRYIEPDWKRTIYQPKMDIFIKLFSQYKGDWPLSS